MSRDPSEPSGLDAGIPSTGQELRSGDVVNAHVPRIRADAERLAATLLAATDAGVPPAVIVPTLILVFREKFGAAPEGMLANVGTLLGGQT